jgi:hypothetical protein
LNRADDAGDVMRTMMIMMMIMITVADAAVKKNTDEGEKLSLIGCSQRWTAAGNDNDIWCRGSSTDRRENTKRMQHSNNMIIKIVEKAMSSEINATRNVGTY